MAESLWFGRPGCKKYRQLTKRARIRVSGWYRCQLSLRVSLKVAGCFAQRVQDEGVVAAVKGLSFRSALVMFTEIGVAPNISEEHCARWLEDLLCTCLVDALRAEAGANIELPVKARHEISSKLLGAVLDTFGDETRMSSTIEVLRSTNILFEAAVAPSDRLPHAPSALRAAIKVVTEVPYENGPTHLAFRFGQVGQHLLSFAADHVTGSAQDEVATNPFSEALKDLNSLACGEDDFDAKEVSTILRKLEVSVTMWGKSSREAMSGP